METIFSGLFYSPTALLSYDIFKQCFFVVLQTGLISLSSFIQMHFRHGQVLTVSTMLDKRFLNFESYVVKCACAICYLCLSQAVEICIID